MKKALIFGSSGFIGSHLLHELLSSSDYGQVAAVVRKDLKIVHPKLRTLIGDYNSLPQLSADLSADEVFIALGTTKKKSPDRAEYYRIDHDYPVLAARIAKEQGATSVFLVSAVGADPNSNVFYVRTKGETERDIVALNFEHTHIFRPSMLLGNREENRPAEKLLGKVWPVIDLIFVGQATRYKGITGEDVARAMKNSARDQSERLKVYHWKEMKELSAQR